MRTINLTCECGNKMIRKMIGGGYVTCQKCKREYVVRYCGKEERYIIEKK